MDMLHLTLWFTIMISLCQPKKQLQHQQYVICSGSTGVSSTELEVWMAWMFKDQLFYPWDVLESKQQLKSIQALIHLAPLQSHCLSLVHQRFGQGSYLQTLEVEPSVCIQVIQCLLSLMKVRSDLVSALTHENDSVVLVRTKRPLPLQEWPRVHVSVKTSHLYRYSE